MRKNILLHLKNIICHITDSNKNILCSLLIIFRHSSIILFILFNTLFLSFTDMLFFGLTTSSSLSASAVSYQDNINLQFTFNPTLSITITGDNNGNLVIPSLSPGSSSDSNNITVTTSSNVISGYKLYANVGNSTHSDPSFNNTNLNHSNGTSTFTNLSTNKPTLADFDSNSNTWGYSYSLDDGTTWISGDYDNSSLGYNGLPLYTTSTGIKLVDTSASSSSNSSGSNNSNSNSNSNTANNTTNNATPNTTDIQFKIGVRASNTQLAGTYTNSINFIAITNPSPTTFYDAFNEAASEPGSTIVLHNGYYAIQDMTTDICEAVDIGSNISLIDIRDNEIYMVGKLKDERCWMLDNLRLDPTAISLETLKGNTNASDTTLEYLKGIRTGTSSDQYAESAISSAWTSYEQNSYTVPYISTGYKDNTVTSYGIGSGKVGVYYNYCAASAGSYCYPENAGAGDAPEDLCPSSWRLPTSGNNGEFRALCSAYNGSTCASVNNHTTMAATSTSSLQYNLSTPLSGGFWDGVPHRNGEYGIFWSSTFFNTNDILRLLISPDDVSPSDNNSRWLGFSVRCVSSLQF